MSTEPIKQYTVTNFQAAGMCNGQGEMPLAGLIDVLIQTATGHANKAGFGYAGLIEHNCSWVLSRVVAKINSLPVINSTYILDTWVENVGRLMTNRNFEMRDAATGNVMIEAKTVWCAINLDTRRPADLPATFPGLLEVINPRKVNIELGPKPRPVREVTDPIDNYRFRFSDIDLNRHVNSCRYVELIADHYGMEFYDHNRVAELDIVFHHEALFNQQSYLKVATDGDTASIELAGDSDITFCLARLRYERRSQPIENNF